LKELGKETFYRSLFLNPLSLVGWLRLNSSITNQLKDEDSELVKNSDILFDTSLENSKRFVAGRSMLMLTWNMY